MIELYKKQNFVFSIEIFPPKTEKSMDKLKMRLEKFNGYTPDYFSVTYGAGGTCRANTHEMAAHRDAVLRSIMLKYSDSVTSAS